MAVPIEDIALTKAQMQKGNGMIAIIDYGVGNLFSLKSSFHAIGEEAVVTSDPATIREADHVILPGVGAFGDAVTKLRERDLFEGAGGNRQAVSRDLPRHAAAV